MCLGQVWSVCRKDVERLPELCVGLELPVSKRLLLSVFMRWRDSALILIYLERLLCHQFASDDELVFLTSELIGSSCGLETKGKDEFRICHKSVYSTSVVLRSLNKGGDILSYFIDLGALRHPWFKAPEGRLYIGTQPVSVDLTARSPGLHARSRVPRHWYPLTKQVRIPI